MDVSPGAGGQKSQARPRAKGTARPYTRGPDILLVALCRPWTAGRHRPAVRRIDLGRDGMRPGASRSYSSDGAWGSRVEPVTGAGRRRARARAGLTQLRELSFARDGSGRRPACRSCATAPGRRRAAVRACFARPSRGLCPAGIIAVGGAWRVPRVRDVVIPMGSICALARS